MPDEESGKQVKIVVIGTVDSPAGAVDSMLAQYEGRVDLALFHAWMINHVPDVTWED